MGENTYPVDNTPQHGERILELSGGGSDGAIGGSVEVNDVSNVIGGSVVMKRKRGRPKKLPVEAQSVMMVSSAPNPLLGFQSPNLIHPPQKRGRGRPKGSFKAKVGSGGSTSPPPGFGLAEGTYGYGEVLKSHLLPIYPGEDVHGRILSFAQSGNRAVTVLSCTGPVARISINSLGSTGGMVYEGLFEILTLNGTFTCGGLEGSYHRRGMLTASLAKPNGEVFGGCVSGPIIAAGPVQLIVGSFEQGRRPSLPTTQLRSYVSPHMPEPRPNPTPPPPPPPPTPATTSQVTVVRTTENFQQSSQNQVTAIPSDQLITNAPDTSVQSKLVVEQVSTPFLNMPPSPLPNVDLPQLDTEAQVIEPSFHNENPANGPDQ